MDSLVCCLCNGHFHAKKLVSLFSTVGEQQGWASRISQLLEVTVSRDERHSHLCKNCRARIVTIEKTLEDLAQFREQVKSRLTTNSRGPLKRTKETSSSEGVSPDILQERPQSKRPVLQSILPAC